MIKGKRMDKIKNRYLMRAVSFLIILVVLLLIVSYLYEKSDRGRITVFTTLTHQQLKAKLAGGTYCKKDEDCVNTYSCTLGCRPINVTTAKEIIADSSLLEKVYRYENCAVKSWGCQIYPVSCVNNQCQTVSQYCEENTDCTNLNCSTIVNPSQYVNEWDLMIATNEHPWVSNVCPENRNEAFCVCDLRIK